MPRSALNRTLGETSLELKCLLLFGLSLLPVITVSFLLYWGVTGQLIAEQNPATASPLVDQGMFLKHWEELGRGSDYQSDRDFIVYFMEEVADQLAQQEHVWSFVPSEDWASKPDTRPDEFERELIHRLVRSPPRDKTAPQYFERTLAAGDRYGYRGEVYQYYQPLWAHKTCLTPCHLTIPGAPGFDPSTIGMPNVREPLQEGDLMGLVRITLPNGQTQESVARSWNLLLAVAIITAFLAVVAFYFVIRYVIVRPLRHLRNVSDAISHGNVSLRADIHTGDEFESLSMAFNRMLGHLVAVQDELRQVNTDLDAKVDELAQLNMQLYELNRIKSDFLATMSHELRTPLNSILGFSDVLGSIDSLDDKQKRYVEHIRKSGRMLLDMINNVLDLAKIESGRMDIRLTDFHIGQVIDAQSDMARPLLEKKNIDFETEVESGLPAMHQDQSRVQQIINNLLSNAIKFTPEGGRVKISAERADDGDLVLQVIDTGVGIAEEDQHTIFEKFRQGRTALPGGDAMTREYSGTGLGLSIVRELCRLLGGEVSVESQLGTGSTFTVRLPWTLEYQARYDLALDDGEEPAGSRLERLRAM
jgi:signal transduction histidine kinase